ncbi:hypothetical protein GGX14DRAFT_393477 [Mycena pura]|uniref:Uncharacterized protein n=1 Tax=Mycena pura TaxID=153505 RepID=A0AAD6VGS1_9AGAR|nr:hypothetical protein GGX14DRAFT_393477 [Mycena pura]
MSSVWLIRELFGWGHWTWRWGNSQRCEKVDYQDWSPCQPRRAPSMVINRRYTIKESIQLGGAWCNGYHAPWSLGKPEVLSSSLSKAILGRFSGYYLMVESHTVRHHAVRA